MVRRRAIVAAVALALGVAAWGWGVAAWPGHRLIRGHGGDVAAAALVYAAIGLCTRARPWRCAVAAAVVAVAVEVGQLAWGARVDGATAVALGTHFDPWDLCAYGLGVAAAWAADRA